MEKKPCIRAIIFDLGGVILRTDDPAPRTQLAERLNLSRWDLETIVFGNELARPGEEGEEGMEAIWEHIVHKLGLTDEDIVWVRRDFFGGDIVDMKLVHLIRSFHPRYKTGLLSNTWVHDLKTYITEQLGMPEDTFDSIVSSSYHGIAKPKPGIYQISLKELDAQPNESIFVDDNEQNIAAAKDLGMNTVRFRSFEQAKQEIEAILRAHPEGCPPL